MNAEAPLGIFDSGVGGLTVVQAIRQLMPHESIVYLGDTARVPYGEKSPATIRTFSREICRFLQAKGVKAIVVACNTASAHALQTLQKEFPLPVFGVIDPGVQTALQTTRCNKIGIIGTRGTIRSQAYQTALNTARPGVELLVQATPLLVPLVEENYLQHAATRLVLEDYLKPLLAGGIDTLVLACTHYPLLKPLLQEIAGAKVQLVDSASVTAQHLHEYLSPHHLLNPGKERGTIDVYLTDMPIQFPTLAERFLHEKPSTIEVITLPSSA